MYIVTCTGPDIDSPERVKKMTGDKLTDLEGLLASLRLENAPLQNPRPSLQTTNSKDSELTSSTSASSSASTTSGSSAGVYVGVCGCARVCVCVCVHVYRYMYVCSL